MNHLKIFISSTCYDLSQIRSDLKCFLTDTGHQPILSESSSFPIDPDSDTLENCISNVAKSDIFVLIVGSRYGYVSDSGKSITNTEYLHAKQMGIPIYVFIYKPLINILPIWKKNLNADFSETVDSNKVFAFVEELREKNRSWCFEFEKAQDIIHTLKLQLSNLFKQSLDLRKKYRITDQPPFYKNLSPTSLNIILKKEDAFESKFFLQVLRDELDKYEDLKLDLEYKILINCNQTIENTDDLNKWLKINFETITNFLQSLENLVNIALKFFTGENGTPSDLKGIYYVSCGIAKLYKETSIWSLNIKSTKVLDDFSLVRDTLSDLPAMSLEEIWSYPSRTLQELQEGLVNLNKDSSKKVTVQSTLYLNMDENIVSVFTSEMNRLGQNRNQS